MKKLILVFALGLGLAGGSVFGHDRDNDYDEHSDYMPVRYNRLGYEINHLNRMYDHVRWEMSRYGTGWHIRREVRHISGEINHVNWQYRNGGYGWYRLEGEIEHIHAELHHVEQELHVRAGDYYRWY